MSDQTHEQESEIKAKVAAELREATVAEASAEELPDENTVSKAAVYLNTKLPKTRTIAQALVRDEAGGHHPHVQRHPARHRPAQRPLEAGQVLHRRADEHVARPLSVHSVVGDKAVAHDSDAVQHGFLVDHGSGAFA